MKFPKIKTGIIITTIGLIGTLLTFSSKDVIDVICGLLVGFGIGLIFTGWNEKRYGK